MGGMANISSMWNSRSFLARNTQKLSSKRQKISSNTSRERIPQQNSYLGLHYRMVTRTPLSPPRMIRTGPRPSLQHRTGSTHPWNTYSNYLQSLKNSCKHVWQQDKPEWTTPPWSPPPGTSQIPRLRVLCPSMLRCDCAHRYLGLIHS